MRSIARLSPVLALAVVLSACAGIPTATPTPFGPPPSPAPPVDGPPTAPPPPDTTATPDVPAAPSPDASPSPSPDPAPTPIAGPGWRYLADFPAGAALAVSSISATGSGFVAVGAEPAPGEDADGVRQGVIWTSSDGIAWQRESEAAFHGANLDFVVELDGVLYLFGFHSTCPAFDDECPTAADAGNAAWRGTADGIWTRLDVPSSLRDAVIDGVSVAGGQVIVRGSTGDEADETLWSTSDGRGWQTVSQPAGLDYIGALIDGPTGIVALGTVYDVASDTIATQAAYSGDGRTFNPASVPDDMAVFVEAAALGPAGVVAVGNEVPVGAPESAAAMLLSQDGRDWTAGPADPFSGAILASIHALPGGYLVLGSVPLPGDELLAGRAWVSSDGLNWRQLAALDGAAYSEFSGAATGPAGAVVFAVELSDEATLIHAWHAAPGVIGQP